MIGVHAFAAWVSLAPAVSDQGVEDPRAAPPPIAIEGRASARSAVPPRSTQSTWPEGWSVVPEDTRTPPFYTASDVAALRARHGLTVADSTPPRRARWRCLIADPTCGFSFEVNATSAYAARFRQGRVTDATDVYRWSSGRAQYDAQLNIPALVETVGPVRYTRISLGPRVGIIASDGGELWGHVGLAMRHWFSRGRFAPAIEVSGALSFRLTRADHRDDGALEMSRSPVGFTADVGFGLGGFGALVVGGQYESPLVREDVPDPLHVSPGGMVFVGFRGNVLWGAPAAAAVTTHALTHRFVDPP